MAAKCNDSKRRDHKGRVLKTGESQHADLIFQYRFTDIRGKRHCIYYTITTPILHHLPVDLRKFT